MTSCVRVFIGSLSLQWGDSRDGSEPLRVAFILFCGHCWCWFSHNVRHDANSDRNRLDFSRSFCICCSWGRRQQWKRDRTVGCGDVGKLGQVFFYLKTRVTITTRVHVATRIHFSLQTCIFTMLHFSWYIRCIARLISFAIRRPLFKISSILCF